MNPLVQWEELVEKCKPVRPEPALAFFVGYACGAARSRENIDQILKAFQKALKPRQLTKKAGGA